MTALLILKPSSQGQKTSELTPYISAFQELCLKYKSKLCEQNIGLVTIKFGQVDKTNAAECYPYSMEVVIDRKYFNMLPVEGREELVFHELGHCVLGLSHTKTGIMVVQGMNSPSTYRKKYQKLIDDLFGCTIDCPKVSFQKSRYVKGKKMSKKDEILANDHAVVRFTADWCGPCRNMKPVFEEVALANPSVKVYVIDIDKDEATAQAFGIKAIPTLVKILDKQEQTRTVGGQTKDKIEELFKK